MAGLTPEEQKKKQDDYCKLVDLTLRAARSPVDQELPDGTILTTGRMVGEAAIEAREFAYALRTQEVQRAAALSKTFPYAVVYVDPSEFFGFPNMAAAIEIHDRYEPESMRWLRETFQNRDGDFHYEICSPGVTWIRFKHAADSESFIQHFRAELRAFDARVHAPNQKDEIRGDLIDR